MQKAVAPDGQRQQPPGLGDESDRRLPMQGLVAGSVILRIGARRAEAGRGDVVSGEGGPDGAGVRANQRAVADAPGAGGRDDGGRPVGEQGIERLQRDRQGRGRRVRCGSGAAPSIVKRPLAVRCSAARWPPQPSAAPTSWARLRT